MITGEIRGINNLSRRLSKELPDDIVKELAKAVHDEAKAIQADAMGRVPVASGLTRSSITIHTAAKGLSAKIGVFSAARGYVARFLTFGVKPHTIAAVNARFLKIGSGFARSIRHPGINPHDFLLGPSEASRARFQERLRQAIIAALRKNDL